MKTFLIALLTIAAISPVWSYKYPIGIPAAWIDPDVKQAPRPVIWESEVAGYYYIDNTHPQATDTNNTYGYPARPRTSIPTSYAAGSRIEVHGGPYTGSQLILNFNGIDAAPCWFIGIGSPIIRRATILKGSYLFFDGFKYDTSRTGVAVRPHDGSNVHHAVVRNCLIEGQGVYDGTTSALSVYGVAGNRFHDIVIFNNTIHDLGDDAYRVDGVLTENDYHGMICSADADNIWFLDNEVYNMGGDSIQIGTATIADGSRVNRIFVGNNQFHDNLENAVDVKAANNIVISQNHCYSFSPVTSLSGVAIVTHNNPSGVWYLFNRVRDAGSGLVDTGSSNTWYIGNLIHNIHHDPAKAWDPNSGYASGVAMHMRATTGGGCVYNTIYDYDIGVQLPTGGLPDGYLVKGNIFANRATGGGDDIYVSTSNVASVTTLDYNFYTDMAVNFAGRDFDSPSVLFTSTTQEAHGVESLAIRFKNISGFDFSLDRDSPAVDAGPRVDETAFYADFQARFGIDIRTDASGVARPQRVAWDIGAYEYSAAIPAPGAPKVEPVKGQ